MKPSKYENECRGSILIIALWSISILTIMAVILGSEVRQKLVLVKRLDDRAKARLIIDAGVKKAITQLSAEAQEQYDSLNQKWSNDPEAFKDITVGAGRFSVSSENDSGELRYGLSDEESKININRSEPAVMARLFKLAGLEDLEAQDLANSIVDWRDADSELYGPGGAEDDYYHTLALPYSAKNAPFQTVDELLLVKGVDENIFQKIRKYITIYGDGAVNINTAGKTVLMAVGFSENITDRIINYRNGRDGQSGTADDNYFDSTSDIASKISDTGNLNQAEQALITNISSEGLVSVKSSDFTIRCQAILGANKPAAEAICVINRRGKILYWSEF